MTTSANSLLVALASAFLLHFTRASRAEDASLEIKSISPVPPAELKAGERLFIMIEYKNPAARPARIFVRPVASGQSTGGYIANPSPLYTEKSGEMEGYFYFNHPATVDEVCVHMYDTAHKELATASRKIKATWTGTKAPATPRPATASAPRGESPTVGQTVDLKFTAIDGREVDLAKLRGQVVLIDFWASWCGPCVAQIPRMLEAYRNFHDRGFEIIGISFDQDKITLERMLQRKGVTWPHYFDGQGWQNQFGAKYGITGLPTMWLIDQEGRVAATAVRKDLSGLVEALLAGKSLAGASAGSR